MSINNTNELVSLLSIIINDKLTNFSNYNVDIHFDTSLMFGKGYLSTSSDIKSLHDVTGITIGIKSLDMNLLELEKIPFLVKTVFHELRHVEQEYYHKNEISPLMYSMGLTYISCLLYHDYYRNTYNYFHNIKEIDAEYYGLKNMYVFLYDEFDECFAQTAVLRIINHHVDKFKYNSNKLYYIPVCEYYTNIDSVWIAFENAISKSITVRRECDFWKNDEVFSKVYYEKNGQLQDELIVKQYFDTHPDDAYYIKNNTVALKKL